jgi:GNAT superfamily N-acetyltransferase
VSKAPFRISLLSAEHDRSAFNSGSKPLDSYLRQQVTQDSRRRITACFVALDADNRIAGYYTLASASLLLSELPADIGKKLPRYPSVPAVRLGRLAVDQNFQGQGLGGALLADALDRAYSLGNCCLRDGGRTPRMTVLQCFITTMDSSFCRRRK